MTEHIYIMGAARSGTTLLTVLLGSHPRARARGEVLHLQEHWLLGRRCSCGEAIASCPQWVEAGKAIGAHETRSLQASHDLQTAAERHRKILAYFLAPASVPAAYKTMQEKIFAAISGGATIVDESKYVARALALSRLTGQKFRFVYIVRDCRGVLHSFAKNVQRPRGFMSSVLYYFLINAAAQLAAWTRLRGRTIKVRYEDLIASPERELMRIGRFVGLDMTPVIEKIKSAEPIAIGHLVSGNRLRASGSLKIRSDEPWRESYGWGRRILAYLMCLPLQALNRYRI